MIHTREDSLPEGPEAPPDRLTSPELGPLIEAAARLSLLTREVALALLRDGLALAEVGGALQLPPRLLLFWGRADGLKEPPQEESCLGVEDTAVDLLYAGRPVAAIAERLGVSPHTVRLWGREAGLSAAGVELEPLVAAPFDLVRDAALRAVAAGWAMLDVAHVLGVDNTTVREWARRGGVRPSRRAERAAAERAVPELRVRHRVNRCHGGAAGLLSEQATRPPGDASIEEDDEP